MNPDRSVTPFTGTPIPTPEMLERGKSDTDPSELGEEMPESAPPKTQLDRIEEHLVSLHIRIDGIDARVEKIEKRLGEGDAEFQSLKWDIGLCSNAVKHLCILGGAKEQAMILTDRIAERFDGTGTLSGVEPYHRDEPTNPGKVG